MCDEDKVIEKSRDKASDSCAESAKECGAGSSLREALAKQFPDVNTRPDVILIVEENRFYVNKSILGGKSDYFHALFYGKFKEAKQTEIELNDVAADPFELVLKYIYLSEINFRNVTEKTIMKTLELARRFNVEYLETVICKYLKEIISIANVWDIFDQANTFLMPNVRDICMNFVDNNARDILLNILVEILINGRGPTCTYFLNLSEETLSEILARDSFCCDEMTIFRMVKKWIEHNQPEKVENIVRHIRLLLVDIGFLVQEVWPSTFFPDSVILSAIESQLNGNYQDINFRKLEVVDQNLASSRFGAIVLHGNDRQYLLNGNSSDYTNASGFTWHSIEEGTKGIMVDLKKPYSINRFKMLIMDVGDEIGFSSYGIEISVDGYKWFLVIDKRGEKCRSWQRLRCPDTVARFIRILGTYNSAHRNFKLVSFECSYEK